MRDLGLAPEERDLARRPLTEAELDRLIGDRPFEPFLNTRNALYRERDMKRRPPGRQEALRLMAQHPNLIRRPLLIDGERIVFGFDEGEYRSFVE